MFLAKPSEKLRQISREEEVRAANMEHLATLRMAAEQALYANGLNPGLAAFSAGELSDQRDLRNGHTLEFSSGHMYSGPNEPFQQIFVGLLLRKNEIRRKHLRMIDGTRQLKVTNLVVLDLSSYKPWRNTTNNIRVHYPDVETMTEALTGQVALALADPMRMYNAHAADLYRDQMG